MTDSRTPTNSTAAPRRPGSPVGVPTTIEWPTIAIAALAWAGLVGGILTHELFAWWITVPVVAVASGLYASLQHEVSHGHPTPWPLINTGLAGVPFGLVYPLARFCDLHLAHHGDPAQLTEPGIDNESRYCSAEAWERAGALKRLVLRAERTLVGHLTIGVVRGSLGYIIGDLRYAFGDRRIRLIWVRHVAAIAVLMTFVVLSGMPLVQYAVAAVYGRVFFTGLRTFAEHRGVPEGTRSAVVQAGLPLRLIFLNNNLHHTHHAAPGMAWYRLPKLHDELGSAELARQGAGLYTGGYLELARRYAFRPFCQPVHPSA
jgi:fatty acid desaturase